MFIELQDIRDAHQAAHPTDYAKHYDDAFVTAYNAVFTLFVDAVKRGITTGKFNAGNLDAGTYPTLNIKSAVLSTVTLAQVSGLTETVMVAHDHGRDEGCDAAFVDAVSTAIEQLGS